MGIHATVIGNLGRDPESRSAGNSTVCNFSVATSHGRGERETTTWVRVAVWGKRGEVCQRFLTKGQKVACVGTLFTREYEGKTYVELDCNDFEFLTPKGSNDGQRSGGYGSGSGGSGNSGGYGSGGNAPSSNAPADEDIPF